MLLTFSCLENFRKNPQWKLGNGTKPQTSQGPQIPFEKLPLELGCEVGHRV